MHSVVTRGRVGVLRHPLGRGMAVAEAPAESIRAVSAEAAEKVEVGRGERDRRVRNAVAGETTRVDLQSSGYRARHRIRSRRRSATARRRRRGVRSRRRSRRRSRSRCRCRGERSARPVQLVHVAHSVICVEQVIAAVVVVNHHVLNAVGVSSGTRVSGGRRRVVVLEEGVETDLGRLVVRELEHANVALERLVVTPDREEAGAPAHAEREESFAVRVLRLCIGAGCRREDRKPERGVAVVLDCVKVLRVVRVDHLELAGRRGVLSERTAARDERGVRVDPYFTAGDQSDVAGNGLPARDPEIERAHQRRRRRIRHVVHHRGVGAGRDQRVVARA